MGNYNYPVVGPVVKRITKPINKPPKNPARGGATTALLDSVGGIQMAYFPPTGKPGSYKFRKKDVLVYPAGISPNHASGFTIDSEGYLYKASGSYENVLYETGDAVFPAKTTSCRLYQMWWSYIATGAPVTNTGVRLFFNIGGSFDDYWYFQNYWNGSAWSGILTEVASGSPVNRASTGATSTLQYPTQFSLNVYDQGDTVQIAWYAYEEDDAIDDFGVMTLYTGAPRAGKDETGWGFGLLNNPGSNARIRGCMITDVEI